MSSPTLLVVADRQRVGAAAADAIVAALDPGEPMLGVATGRSPATTYAHLGRFQDRFDGLSLYQLDEYVGLDPTAACSYRATILESIAPLLGVDRGRVHGPVETAADALDPHLAASRYESVLADAGPLDVQLLGIGANGHIGFNEPGSPLDSRTRVVELDETTRRANANTFGSVESVPRSAITQGIATIMRARRLVLVALGATKAPALAAALEGPTSPDVPASIIQRHPDVVVVADRQAAAGIGRS